MSKIETIAFSESLDNGQRNGRNIHYVIVDGCVELDIPLRELVDDQKKDTVYILTSCPPYMYEARVPDILPVEPILLPNPFNFKPPLTRRERRFLERQKLNNSKL